MKVLRIGSGLYELTDETVWEGDDVVIVELLNDARQEFESTIGPADGDPRANIFQMTLKAFNGTIVLDDEKIDQTERVY